MISLQIDKFLINGAQPPFIVAEAGINHNGKMELAERLVDAAADAGAHAVKFQTFEVSKLVTRFAKQASYQKANSGLGESQLSMLARVQLSRQDHVRLMEKARDRKILFLSTPFDFDSADFLINLKLPAIKMSSGDLNNLPFLRHLAKFKGPKLISTGMGTLSDVEKALETLGKENVCLLHCTSDYPTQPQDANLRVIHTLRTAFEVWVGYSDHTTGIEASLAATALGAVILEKHLTLDRNLEGPDHKASLEPAEFRKLVDGAMKVHCALGSAQKKPCPSEIETALVARKSLVSACNIRAGEKLSEHMVSILRPGSGIEPGMLEILLGMTLSRDVVEGTPLQWKHFK